jgi:hypothetical protein
MNQLPEWAVPGAKVVCVPPRGADGWTDRFANIHGPWPGPRPGEVFAIVRTLIRFEEGWIELDGYPREWHEIRCFRPVVDDKTEAEIFRKAKRPVLE